MQPHHRTEGSPFKPAYQKASEFFFFRIPSRKASDIGGPPGDSGNSHIQSGTQLSSESFPVRMDIPGPDKGSVTLASRPCAAHQADCLFFPCTAQPFIKCPCEKLGIQISHLCLGSHAATVIIIIINGKARLRFIQPEKAYSFFVIILSAFFPKIIPGIRIGHIGKGTVFIKKLGQINTFFRLNQKSLLLHFFIIFTGTGHLRPYRYHQLHAHFLKRTHHAFRIREKFLVKTEISHSGPMKKVTHNNIQRDSPPVILSCCLKKLLLVPVPQLALPEAQAIFGHLRHSPGDRCISTFDFIRRIPCRNPIIHLPGTLCLPLCGIRTEADTPHRRIMPQETIPQAGQYKRNAYLGISLRKLQAAVLNVQKFLLVLPHSIQLFLCL